MTEYVHLSGAEDVRRAGGMIQSAAEDFARNVGWLTEALERDRNARAEQSDLENARRTEAVDRFEQLVGRLEKLSTDNADRKEAAIGRLLASAGSVIGVPLRQCEKDPACTQGRGHVGACLPF